MAKKKKSTYKRKVGRRKKPGRKPVKLTQAEVIQNIFYKDESDLCYITKNSKLKAQHIKLIQRLRSVNSNRLVPKSIKEGIENPDLWPKAFKMFNVLYKSIYNWWIYLLRCCYDKTYVMYQFFGARGITLSSRFLDGKNFCIWALNKGLTNKAFTYTTYIQRKNRNIGFSERNCYVITEKEVHECKTLEDVLNSLYIIKKYEEGHDHSVSYMTYYTRCYIYNLPPDDARMWPHYRHKIGEFSPVNFYQSVADDTSVTATTFMSRVHYAYLNGGHTMRPYEMLKPEYSVMATANAENKLSYKQQYNRNKKAEKGESVYCNKEINSLISTNEDLSVYSNNNEMNPYSQ